jgi:hypothetical protein
MTPNFRQATPDAALRFLTATAVNRMLAWRTDHRRALTQEQGRRICFVWFHRGILISLDWRWLLRYPRLRFGIAPHSSLRAISLQDYRLCFCLQTF